MTFEPLVSTGAPLTDSDTSRYARHLSLPRIGGEGQRRLRNTRALVIGARRTAEELARAFPGVPVHTSGAGTVLDQVSAAPSIVIATPGAEPLVDGGYPAALLLDAWALLDRPSIDAAVEALRRWAAAAALVPLGQLNDAVRALHTAYGLDSDQVEAVVYGGTGR